MAEYNIHHDVRQLMKILKVEENGSDVTEDDVAEQFIKSVNSCKSSSAAYVRKANPHKNGDFQKLYDDLKSRNVIELDPLVNLLARINENEDMRNYLRLHNAISTKSRREPKADERESSVCPSSLPSDVANPSSDSTPPQPLSPACQMPLLNAGRSMQNISSETVIPNDLSRVSGGTTKTSKTAGRKLGKSRVSSKSSLGFLSLDYSTADRKETIPLRPLNCFSLLEQENILMKDLLSVLIGVEGDYIRLKPYGENSRKNILVVDDAADKLLRTLAVRIINICPQFSSVIHFMDEVDTGFVNQALAACMRGVIKDYMTLVAQLEYHLRRNNLTLQKMWYYLQPFFKNMEILKYFSHTICHSNVVGGAVLSILHNKTISYSGDPKALDFCLQITRDVSVPFFTIFDKWMTEGIVVDLFNEFFVEDCLTSKDMTVYNINDDSYWENKFKLIPCKMPIFLSRFQEKMLNTGKYLNAIRACGKEIAAPIFPEETVYTTEERYFTERVEMAYQAASQQLLHHLLEDSDLVGHLHSVKHYFFMDQGDFMTQFMDMAEDELSKDINDTNPVRLSSLLELALKTSIMQSDPHHEDVSVELLEDSLLTQLSKILNMGPEDPSGGTTHQYPEDDFRSLRGFEAIALSYHVRWPLSLILSQKNIACYQMLFRHLFLCKYVERRLGYVWVDNKVAKFYALKAVTGYAEAFALRQKMLNFVQNLSYYMMVEVIEPNFHSFISRVESQTQVDELSKEHTHFVEGCLKDCMLTQKSALHFMITLLHLCLDFSHFMQENHKHSAEFELQQEVQKDSPTRFQATSACMDFEDQVRDYHEQFNSTLLELLQEIMNQQQDHFSGNILHILYRLDFNEFFARMREENQRSYYNM